MGGEVWGVALWGFLVASLMLRQIEEASPKLRESRIFGTLRVVAALMTAVVIRITILTLMIMA